MTLHRMDHVGITVRDREAAIEFFVELGFELQGKWDVEGDVVDGINGLDGVRSDCAMLQTPDGKSQLELVKYNAPPNERDAPQDDPPNVPGLRHLCFAVDDLEGTLERLRPHGAELVGKVERYDPYLLCYLRGPDGLIVELAEKVGASDKVAP